MHVITDFHIHTQAHRNTYTYRCNTCTRLPIFTYAHRNTGTHTLTFSVAETVTQCTSPPTAVTYVTLAPSMPVTEDASACADQDRTGERGGRIGEST